MDEPVEWIQRNIMIRVRDDGIGEVNEAQLLISAIDIKIPNISNFIGARIISLCEVHSANFH